MKLSEMMNIHCPVCSIMSERDARAVVDLKRTSTLEFKRKRFNARKQKCNKLKEYNRNSNTYHILPAVHHLHKYIPP